MDQERKKLLEATAIFVSRTRNCGLVKLFKLLYFLDMLHFRETGRSVTGLTYVALPYGPVPTSFYGELQGPLPEDVAAKFSIKNPPPKNDEMPAPERTVIAPTEDPRDMYLTVREKRICAELVEIFYSAKADDMSNISHAKGGPWDKARNRNPGKWKEIIDYLDALSPTLNMGSGKPLKRELLKARAEEFEMESGYIK